jgi:hypothetical protein
MISNLPGGRADGKRPEAASEKSHQAAARFSGAAEHRDSIVR